MRAAAVIVVTALILAACGERSEPAAPTTEKSDAPVAPASVADADAPSVLTAAQLRRVCQTGLAEIHGQGVTDIQIDGLDGKVFNASWRAPVDGGRRRAQCRVDGDLVIWKLVDTTNPEENRWMDRAGDPVTRFVLDGETVTINQTLPGAGVVAEVQGQG